MTVPIRTALRSVTLSGALLVGAAYAKQQAAPPVTSAQLRAAFMDANAALDGQVISRPASRVTTLALPTNVAWMTVQHGSRLIEA